MSKREKKGINLRKCNKKGKKGKTERRCEDDSGQKLRSCVQAQEGKMADKKY